MRGLFFDSTINKEIILSSIRDIAESLTSITLKFILVVFKSCKR